jgi:hypothetical protein
MNEVVCLTGERFTDYHKYLHSVHWQNVRDAYRESPLYKNRCYVCHSIPSKSNIMNIHHRSYKNIGRELSQDLVELCRDCHYNVHTLIKGTSKFNRWKKSIDLCFAVEYLRTEHVKSMKTKHQLRNGTIKLLTFNDL